MKDTYGPPSGKRAVLMIGDLSMRAKHLFGESARIRSELTISTGDLTTQWSRKACIAATSSSILRPRNGADALQMMF